MPSKSRRALKHLLMYLRSTIKYRLCLGTNKDGQTGHLIVYSDADWASDKADRKSITGSTGILGVGALFWISRKKTSVATSTTEAEYIAMSLNAKQGQWLAQILRDIGYGKYVAKNVMTVDTKGDNQGAIALIKNGRLNNRSKHFDIAMHHVRDGSRRSDEASAKNQLRTIRSKHGD